MPTQEIVDISTWLTTEGLKFIYFDNGLLCLEYRWTNKQGAVVKCLGKDKFEAYPLEFDQESAVWYQLEYAKTYTADELCQWVFDLLPE